MLVVGIARPHVVRDVTRNEATIVLAIDTSRSMAATDVQPSRLDAARDAAARVPRGGAGGVQRRDRLVLDLRRPVLPPTTDREAARVALRELRLGSGTAIGDAVDARVDIALGARGGGGAAAQQGERSPAAVLLLSDGAQTSGDVRPLPAAQRARRLGVPVSAVALGTGEAVVEVPLPGGLGSGSSCRPSRQTLRLIAQTTGGTFSPSPERRAARGASTASSARGSASDRKRSR